MKKLLIQLGELILKYRKRLVYGVLALVIGQVCFFNLGGLVGNNVAFAADPETSTEAGTFQEKATNWLQDLSFFQRAFYVLLYPILALAGLLVNNSFVYAEVFKFDVVLWQLWNVVRNLANYALGFIFVFKIFQFLIDEKKAGKMKDILTSTLIAGIGIQASWFLLAVLIDLSNIVAYGIGGLPIKTLGQQTDSDNFGNPYVFRTVISTDTDTPDSVEFYLSTTKTGDNKFISECKTFSYSYDNGGNKAYQELILAPKMIYYYDGEKYTNTEMNACHIGDDVYYFAGLYSKVEWDGCSGDGCKDAQNKYNDSVDNAIKSLQSENLSKIKALINMASLLEIGDAHSGNTPLKIKYTSGEQGLDVDNNRKGEGLGLNRLNNVLSGSYVGVFTALYSSLLNAGTDLRVSEVTDPGIYTSLLDVILSLCHTIAIGIPLIAMLVVFIMRIGVIWMAIVLSPVIILLRAFNLEKRAKDNIDIYKYLSVKSLIGIIFSPAIICFAVSISTVLVRIINAVNMQKVMTDDAYILGGLIKLNIAGLGLNIGRLVCCAIGVAISWFLIWSAIKASELGKSKIVTGLESLAKTAIGSVPIIPIPKKDGGVDFVGASTVFGGNGQDGIFSRISSNLKSKYEKGNTEAIDNLFKSDEELEKDAKNAAARQFSTYKEKLLNSGFGPDWQTEPISIGEKGNNNKISMSFAELNDEQKKEVIKAINTMSDKQKRQDSVRGGELIVGGEEYTFVSTMEKDGKTKEVYQWLTQSELNNLRNS